MVERRYGVALLAAGSSQRFGVGDKLAQTFKGRPLGEHAAIAIPRQRFAQAWVITARPRHRCEAAWRECRFDPVGNREAGEGIGTSVALAAKLAKEARCDALMIALADMPLVPTSHFEAMLDEFEKGSILTVSRSKEANMPPAVFDAAYFVEMRDSAGDKGARELLASGQVVPCPPEWLIDIDTPQDLARHGQ